MKIQALPARAPKLDVFNKTLIKNQWTYKPDQLELQNDRFLKNLMQNEWKYRPG